MKKGIRLDAYLAEHGLSESREKAKREILAGWVRVNGETVRQPSRIVSEEPGIVVERPGGMYVSRGGEKLEHALNYFHIDIRNSIMADLGASTGGFTDCALAHGASVVYAVDVGYGQIDYRLRQDPRVIVMERTNVRNLTGANFHHTVDFVTADLSFISLTKVVDVIVRVFSPVRGVLLIKPQFEALPHEHKKGVVRKKEYHAAILGRVIPVLHEKDAAFKGITYSPITGPAGNIEFLYYFEAPPPESGLMFGDITAAINSAVDEAHCKFYPARIEHSPDTRKI